MNKLLVTLLLVFMISCGDSYIVKDESSSKSPVTAECPLYFTTENLCLKYDWELMPVIGEEFGVMVVKFFDPNTPDTLISPKKMPFLELQMPSMGHGSSPVSVEFIDEGRYRINDIFFSMPGPWEMKFQLKDQDLIVDEAVQDISV